MTQGAKHHGSTVTDGDRPDHETAVRLLNGALATEIVCVSRYQRHHCMARYSDATAIAREFLAYANEEQRHADLIAARITQLGGTLVLSPDRRFLFDHSGHAERRDLIELIREDLVAERLGIEVYREMIRYFGNDDPASRRLLEEILVNEEQHAGGLMALIDILRCEGVPTWRTSFHPCDSVTTRSSRTSTRRRWSSITTSITRRTSTT